MAHRIEFRSAKERCYLCVENDGIIFCRTAALGGLRRFSYEEIDSLLLSDSSILSFQAGRFNCSIGVDATREDHQNAINAFQTALIKTKPLLKAQNSKGDRATSIPISADAKLDAGAFESGRESAA
jgi:hypothetical protein